MASSLVQRRIVVEALLPQFCDTLYNIKLAWVGSSFPGRGTAWQREANMQKHLIPNTLLQCKLGGAQARDNTQQSIQTSDPDMYA